MRNKSVLHFLLEAVCAIMLTAGCRQKHATDGVFVVKDDKATGLHFNNQLSPTQQFNIFTYMYYYNGAGVGEGDFNNDGKPDLFFAANQGENKLYLNEGNLQFKDATQAASIPNDGGWSTGVSIIDINNDGLLDIYVCRVGDYEVLHSKNQLLICQGIDKNGIPHYRDEAAAYGLDFSGFSTQAAFFDYDGDGDLDMYLLNHSVHENGTFGARNLLITKQASVSGDRIFRNDGNGHFTDVTSQTGINSSVLGYGLGVTIADINMDGYPDIYIGNDFYENDYLYINQRNGTFKDELSAHIMHTSEYTMGVDVADANNDGLPDIISMDMLAADPYILKRSMEDDEPDVFNLKRNLGYYYQYSRNNLQMNRGNGVFSEIGSYAGVQATDWSWSPLWLDFDNDGLKDLFISNGIPKRLTDMDYINFVSNVDIQQKLRPGNLDKNDNAEQFKFPEIKIYNKFFRNGGDMRFRDLGDSIGNDQKTFSNGAVYGDLDGDGDLDVVTSNINTPALLYQNKTNDVRKRAYAEISLQGPEKNIHAIGAKVVVYCNGGLRVYEKYPVRGFMSSMETPVHVGLDSTRVDSAFVIWPDNTYQPLSLTSAHVSAAYQKGLPVFNYSRVTGFYQNRTKPMEDITASVSLSFRHQENLFPEFNREPLIPHMISTEGPALAVGDINHDGLEDVFVGSSKTYLNGVFLQQKNGKFSRMQEKNMWQDSLCEDVDAVFTDVNNDGSPDLVIASGGNENIGKNSHLLPRLYLNDGAGNFTKAEDAFSNLYETFSCVVPCDINGDGFTDLFFGGRAVPWEYGQTPRSYLLQNDGHGKFTDVTETYAKDLADIGMVTNAVWFDLNKDGAKDLIVCCEWGGIYAFINQHGKFVKEVLTDKSGWWNFVLPIDVDGDGDIDLVAGNLGRNSRLKATETEPVKLYYNDFDNNGKKEQVISYYVAGKETPFATKDELEKSIPEIKKRYLYAGDFAKASLNEILKEQKLKDAKLLTADYFASAILINDGNLHFTTKELPWKAQLSTYRDAIIVNANNDSLPDILLFGNYYENNIQMGRADADFGTVLINRGKGEFDCENINGLVVKGQVRHVKQIDIAGQGSAFVLAKNNDSVMVIRYK